MIRTGIAAAVMLWVGSVAAEQPPLPVVVKNTPLPVEVQGTPSVNIAAPVVVAGRVPVMYHQDTGLGGACNAWDSSCEWAYTVPAGKTFVIESVYTFLQMEVGTYLQLFLSVYTGPDFLDYRALPLPARKTAEGVQFGYMNPSDVYEVNSPIRAYAPAGSKVWVSSSAVPSNHYQGIGQITIVGYLEPAP